MKIEDLDDSSDLRIINRTVEYDSRRQIVAVDAKRALVGAGARILFYPTLLYNVFRNKIQAEFRWWDQVDQVYTRFPSIIVHLFTLIDVSCYASWSRQLYVLQIFC